ncbi:Rpn family recombination-promoting nuclease/putative transposase [Oceanobacillus jeddahense]|uniref:Rpn family recombination-promoting nuclease/putative transposase n=1 Tax=Oceanobacillus jeddahense TaxID=1462527 RepID=A0ABY5K077_9BACI|nr:Rpn family recombination-promoting nuclease/putative transposase [Oceanobacillus jeddahense]UUI04706.1 Rpn family recombination-promoting nuclease/putative transposase [Oceanobacillus jeddahense]
MPQICLRKVYASTEITSLHIQEESKSYKKYQRRKERTKKALHRIPDVQLMDLKVDYAFKQLFGNEKNKDITVVFLNAILAKSGRSPIQQLYFQNIEIGGEYEEDKKSRLDLLIRTENKEWVNIEIQINNEYNMIKRSLYYWSRLFSEQLKEGQSYKELYPVISINIMHFNLLDETDAFHNIFHLHEIKQKYPLTDMIEFHFVEISKLITAWKNNQLDPWEDVLTRWLLLLGTVDRQRNHFYEDIYQELEEIAMVDKTLNVAMRVWEDLSRTEEERREYEIRLKQILDEQSKKRDRELLEQEMEEVKEQKEEMKIEKEEVEKQREEMKAEKEEAKKQKEEMKAEKEEAEKQREESEIKRKEEERKRFEAETALKESAKQMALKMLEQGISQTAIIQVTGLTPEQLKIIQQETSR